MYDFESSRVYFDEGGYLGRIVLRIFYGRRMVGPWESGHGGILFSICGYDRKVGCDYWTRLGHGFRGLTLEDDGSVWSL